MSYTATKAETGSQTIFSIKIVSTFTPIYEILSFTQSGRINKTVDVTSLNSPAEEWISVLQGSSSFDLTCNRVSSDPGQAGLEAAFTSKAITMFTIVLPLATGQTVTGDSYAFSALVEEADAMSDVAPTKQVVAKYKLKTSGLVVLTVGS